MRRKLLATAVSCALGSGTALANPTGAQLIKGAALLSNPSPNVLSIVNTPGTIIHWQGFSIGAGESTRFVQQNAASAVLNRVVTANPSSILGRLESNGRVFLINPNGIVFGTGAVVDVAGLIASTRNLSDSDFLAGNYFFSGASNGTISIENGAQILTSTYGPGGQVWLFAKDITQHSGSSITTPQGQTVLAAGSQLVVTQPSLGNMNFNVISSGGTIQTLGSIAADRGAVGMFADSITHGGTISTPSSATEQGSVVARARTHFTASANSQIHADGTNGRIDIFAGGTLKVEPLAAVTAAGTAGAGGTIDLTASDMRVFPLSTHAASFTGGAAGTVTLTQTQPSSYVAGAPLTLPALGDGLAVAVSVLDLQPDGNLRLYRADLGLNPPQSQVEVISADLTTVGTAAPASPLVTLDPITFHTFSTLAGGRIEVAVQVQGTALQTLILRNPDGSLRLTTATSDATQFRPLPQPHPLVGGGYVLTRPANLGQFSPAGVLQGSQSSSSFEPFGTGLLDGGYVVGASSIAQPVTWYSQSGTTGGSVMTPTAIRLIAPTATGFVTVGGLLNAFKPIELTPYHKVTPAFTPLATASSNMRAPAGVGTIPGVAQDAAPPPPVIEGSGSGASFGGISGCNSAVCSDEVRAAIAVIGAERAFQQVAAGQADQQIIADAAREAVQKLQEAQSARDQKLEEKAILRDYGEMNRLVAGVLKASGGDIRNDQIVNDATKAQKVLEEFLTHERLLQQTGVYRTNPGEMSVVTMIENMTPDEQKAFMGAVVLEMRKGDL